MVASGEVARDEDDAPPPSVPSWEEITGLLSGENPGDICRWYRALFCTRQVAPSKAAAVELIAQAIRSKSPPSADEGERRRFASVLFRHECCYLLGQVGADCEEEAARELAYGCLHEVLCDGSEDEVTRHEAAEGIAAVHDGRRSAAGTQDEDIKASDMFKTLEKLVEHGGGRGPLAETCYLAVEGIRRRGARRVCACQYSSHDPAIGDPEAGPGDVERYSELLCRGDGDLFDRYVAMFTLRNLGADERLAAALAEDETSPVLRHELAFVLGQMESEAAVSALIRSLRAEAEHAMVRHEAAIALGSIGGEPAKAALRELVDHEEPMVAESCRVALDTAAYWEAWERAEARIHAAAES